MVLDPVLERIEQQCSYDYGRNQAGCSGAGEPDVDQFSNSAYRSEINPHNGRGGQRVGHAALEDEVNVHQAVAEDCVSEGQR